MTGVAVDDGGGGGAVQEDGQQHGEGDNGPQLLGVCVEVLAVAEGVGEVEHRADAADPEHSRDQAFAPTATATDTEQAHPSGGGPHDEDQEQPYQGPLPGERRQPVSDEVATEQEEQEGGQQTFDLFGELVQDLVVAVAAFGGPDGAGGDEDREEAVAVQQLGGPVGEEGGAQGDEALHVLGEPKCRRPGPEEQQAQQPPCDDADRDPDGGAGQTVDEEPLPDPACRGPAAGRRGESERRKYEGEGQTVVQAGLGCEGEPDLVLVVLRVGGFPHPHLRRQHRIRRRQAASSVPSRAEQTARVCAAVPEPHPFGCGQVPGGRAGKRLGTAGQVDRLPARRTGMAPGALRRGRHRCRAPPRRHPCLPRRRRRAGERGGGGPYRPRLRGMERRRPRSVGTFPLKPRPRPGEAGLRTAVGQREYRFGPSGARIRVDVQEPRGSWRGETTWTSS